LRRAPARAASPRHAVERDQGAFFYRPDEAMFDILFSTGHRYLYHDVPPEVAERLADVTPIFAISAPSLGSRRPRHKSGMNNELGYVHATPPEAERFIRIPMFRGERLCVS
jgi:hypothetical protein